MVLFATQNKRHYSMGNWTFLRWVLYNKLGEFTWDHTDAAQNWGSQHLKGHKIYLQIILLKLFYCTTCCYFFLIEIQKEPCTLHSPSAEHPLSLPFAFHDTGNYSIDGKVAKVNHPAPIVGAGWFWLYLHIARQTKDRLHALLIQAGRVLSRNSDYESWNLFK